MLNVKKKNYFFQCHICTSGKKKHRLFLQNFGEPKQSKLLTLPYFVLHYSLLQPKTKKVYNTQGRRGRSPAGGILQIHMDKHIGNRKDIARQYL